VDVVVRRTRRSAAAGVVVAMLAALVVAQIVGVRPAHADTTVGLTTFRDIAVDPSTGRVLVAGDDEVLVYSPSGALVATVPNVSGAGGMDLDGTGNLWVAETTNHSLAKIDLGTFATQTYDVGVPVTGTSLAVVQGAVWFASNSTLERYDPTGGTTTSRGNVLLNQFEKVDATTPKLLTYDMGISAGTVKLLDVTQSPATIVGSWSAGENQRQLAVDATDGVLVSASGWPYTFPESSIANHALDGVVYPGTAYPSAVAYAAGVFAGSTQSANRLFVSLVGHPTTAATATLSHYQFDRALALSPDGGTAYALSTDQYAASTGPFHLEVVHFAPTLSSALPSSVIAGVPTPITLQGTRLIGTSSVTVGGHAAAFTVTSDSQLAVTAPATTTAGSSQVTITTPFGTASTPLTVTPYTGSTIAGTVHGPSGTIAGVSLTLTSASLASSATTTSAAGGTYSFGSLPYATDYTLVAHDAADGFPDQTISGIGVVANGSTVRDVTFTATLPGTDALLATVALPVATPREMLVDPTTNRIFLSGDDEVDVFDHDGHLLTRAQSISGADGLTLGPDGLYVNAKTSGRIVRIDRSSMTQTGSWLTTHPTTGGLAYAGGRLWFSNGNDQWVGTSSLDPATGTVTDSTSGTAYAPRYQSVEGSSTLVFAWDVGSSPSYGYLFDGSAATETQLASGFSAGLATASGSLNRSWTIGGAEYQLSNLTTTGRQFPVGSWGSDYPMDNPVFSSARGGLLAFGSDIDQASAPAVINTLPEGTRLEGFDAGADRVDYVANGQLHVWDLHPHLLSAAKAYTGDTSVSITGEGLQTLASVSIDGTPESATPGTGTGVTVPTSALSLGTHTIVATTSWGASNTLSFVVVARPPAPQVTGISPASVPTAGGSVTITGSGLLGATAVSFGSVAATAFTVVDDTEITASVPAHTAGAATVAVTTPGGTSSTAPPFAWTAPVPVITSLSQVSGPLAGGTPLIISGSGFLYATGVTFGGTPATFQVTNDTMITTNAPSHAAGSVTVAVTTAGGTSTGGPAAQYSYVAPPGAIHGTVRSSSGPIANMDVIITSPDGSDEVAHTTTASDGTFTVGNLQPGSYKVVVENDAGDWFPGFVTTSGSVSWLLSGGASFSVATGATRDIGTVTLKHVPNGSPFGSFDAATGGSHKIHLQGWAIDPDTVWADAVWVYVDGSPAASWWADAERDDVGRAYPFGYFHGFDNDLSASPGPHQVCVAAVNTGVGAHVGLGCKNVTVGTGSPVGSFDQLGTAGPTTLTVSGWTVDPDTSGSIPVDVYVDGHGARYTANASRPDIAAAFPGQGPSHGFNLSILTTPGTHTVCAYAINTGFGSNTVLGCRTITMPSGSPKGSADSIVAGHQKVTVAGWALDPDTTASIPVAIYVGSAGAWYTANGTRADIAGAFPGYGPAHGFTQTIAAPAGTTNVCVYAINQGPGTNTLLRCQSVTVT
jgi:hypothetical protein